MQRMSAYRSETPLLSWSPLEDVFWSKVGGSDVILLEPQDLTEAAWSLNGDYCSKLGHENAHSESEVLDQSAQNLSIPRSKLLQMDPCTDLTVGKVDPAFDGTGSGLSSSKREAWNELMIASHPSVSDCGAVSTSSSVILNLGLSGEDGDDIECNKRAKLGLNDCEYEEVQGLCEDNPLYQGNNVEIVNNSCHFSLYDIRAPEGDLDFFGGEHAYPKEGNNAWGTSVNLEDMDRLLQYNGSLFPETWNESVEEILWPFPSPGPGTSSSHMNFEHASPDASSEGFEMGMEFNLCSNFSSAPRMLTVDCNNELRDPDELFSLSAESDMGQLLEKLVTPESLKERKLDANQTGLESVENDAAPSYLDVDENHKGSCVRASNKQLDDRSKNQVLERSPAPGLQTSPQVCQSHLQYMAVRMQPSLPSHLQAFPSPTTAIPQGFFNTGGGSQSSEQFLEPVLYGCMGYTQNMPTVKSNHSATSYQLQQPHYYYQQPFGDALMQQHQDRKSFDTSSQSSGCSSYMTPQDKIEKLHWRQKMQAKLPLEHQHQHLGKEIQAEQKQLQTYAPKDLQDVVTLSGQLSHTSILESQISSESSASKSELSVEEDDESLEATVLQQLQNNMSKLDIRTRLCIRDALYRLARSAMQRRTLDESRGSNVNNTEPHSGVYGPESSSSDDPILRNQSFLAVNVIETETNPIDRSIANLLFQKCQPAPLAGSMCMPSLSLINGVPTSQASMMPSNSWMWQQMATSQANWVVLPSPLETVLTAKDNSGFASANVEGPDDTCKVVLDHHVCTDTSSTHGNTTLGLPSTPVANFLPGLPSAQSMIFSPSENFVDVTRITEGNCRALPSQTSDKEDEVSATHGKAEHAYRKSQLSFGGVSDGLEKTARAFDESLLTAMEEKIPELIELVVSEGGVALSKDATEKKVHVEQLR